MKKKLFVLLTAVFILALATACGSKDADNKDTGDNISESQSGEQEGNTLTGTLDEKKDFMFVVTDDQGVFYQFSIDSSAKPEGYDDLAAGDSVTVTYTGTVSEVDPFNGTVLSVEKAD